MKLSFDECVFEMYVSEINQKAEAHKQYRRHT